jgi:nitrile hydratase accessory protein
LSAPELPGLPRDLGDAPAFAEPWQAKAFALAVELNARGAFAWREFSAALARACAAEPDYWRAWLAALEAVLAERGLAAPAEVGATADAWRRAAAATPHGRPVTLEAAPRRPPG